MTAVLDTSGMLAALAANAEHHAACRRAVDTTPGPLLVSQLVLAELDYLLGTQGLAQVMTDVVVSDVAEGAYTLADVTPDDLTKAARIMTQYADLRIGLTDAVNVVIADKHRTAQVITLDERHFRVVRPLRGRSAFVLVPFDGASEP